MSRDRPHSANQARRLLAALAASALAACSGVPVDEGVYAPDPENDNRYSPARELATDEFFTAELETSAKDFAQSAEIDAADARIDDQYRLGPGDRFAFLVRGREDITREDIVVAPDGKIALPRIGVVDVGGRTVEELTRKFTEALETYYEYPEVTLVMKEYNNNRVFVLGRVANPGAVNLQGDGTLLEALSLAGGLPADTAKSFLSRCMIVRDGSMVMWIDLKELLERGNLALNARLQNDDVIFIPQSEDQLAYVLGEVNSPGVVTLRSELTLLDAVMTSGGPTKVANLRDIFLVRQARGKGVIERINLKEIIGRGDFRKNYALEDGDLVYIPPTGLGKANYFATKILPALSVIGVSQNILGLRDGFGTVIGGGGQ
mgnify:CR=1 FL=1